MIKEIYRKQLIEDNFVNIHFSLDTTFYFEYIDVPMDTVYSLVGTLGLESIINIVKYAGSKKTIDDARVR